MGRKLGKNKKKAWRNKINISDVEQRLEDERLAERIGPLPQAAFVVEKVGGDPSLLKGPTRRTAKSQTSFVEKSEKGKLKTTAELTEGLSVHRALLSQSKVKPAIKPRSGPKLKPLKVKKNITKSPTILKSNETLFANDIWDEKPLDDMNILKKEQELLRSKRPTKTPSSIFNRPTLIPAVEVPHPGASYNPDLQQHQKLMRKIVDEELRNIKKQKKTADTKNKKTFEQLETEYMEEMKQGLEDEDEGCCLSEEDDDDEDSQTMSKKSVKAENRKTQAQRNREKKMKMLMKLKLKQKANEKGKKNEPSVKNIIKQLKREEELTEQRRKLREDKEKKRLHHGRTRQGRIKFPTKDEVVPLPSDLTGHLREVKVEGNLLKERFNSLIRRNLIEPRSKVVRHRNRNRKKSEKSFVKRSHQEDGDK